MPTRLIDTSIAIAAPPSSVWRALTDPSFMKQWMAEPDVSLDIVTDWQPGSPIVMTGRHTVAFENRGTVLLFEPESVLQYTHLSSISRLPDKPESYTHIEFRLTPSGPDSTSLHLTVSNFPTESIFRHFDFYWRVTLPILQRFIESAFNASS